MNNDDMKYILTIDMGTTAFKAAVFDCEGREAGSATEEYQIQTPRPGWAEMDAEKYTELFKAAVSGAVKNAGISREDILTLGISCQGETSAVSYTHLKEEPKKLEEQKKLISIE